MHGEDRLIKILKRLGIAFIVVAKDLFRVTNVFYVALCFTALSLIIVYSYIDGNLLLALVGSLWLLLWGADVAWRVRSKKRNGKPSVRDEISG